MDEKLIGRTVPLVMGLLPLRAGAGAVTAIPTRPGTMRTMHGGCPCMAMLRGDGHTRD